MKARQLQVIAWGISSTAVVLAFIAWGQGNAWHIDSTYQLFPLFGLLAFSLMWSHYVMAALRMHFKLEKAVLKSYFEATSLAVLAAILLHPGLLTYQLWRDGLGLPPGSELNYVAPSLGIYVVIAMISLLVFLAYEFRRLFGQKPWWKYVQYASDVAILLILLHSLKLGSQLQAGWFPIVWYFYGVTLGIALVYIYYQKYQQRQSGNNKL
jgi:hypothetical protein